VLESLLPDLWGGLVSADALRLAVPKVVPVRAAGAPYRMGLTDGPPGPAKLPFAANLVRPRPSSAPRSRQRTANR